MDDSNRIVRIVRMLTTIGPCMYGHHVQQSMDQPGKVANPARGQLNREMSGKINISLSPFVRGNLISRDGFGRPFPRQPAHSPYQAEHGAYEIPPDFRGGVYLFI